MQWSVTSMPLLTCRESKAVPAKAHVAVSTSLVHQQVAITLQDGSIGATALMRITALFQNPDEQQPAASPAATPVHGSECSHEPEAQPSSQSQAGGKGQSDPGKLKQFSLHIVRCNSVLRSAAPRRTTRSGRTCHNSALLLNVPDFSLQLPAMRPGSLLVPLPIDPQQLEEAARMHFAAGQASQFLSCSSVSLSLTSAEGSGAEPLLSLPSASATIGLSANAEGNMEPGQSRQSAVTTAHLPSISSHVSLRDAKALAVIIHHGLHDWSCLSPPSAVQKDHAANSRSENVPQAQGMAVTIDFVRLRLLPRAEQHAFDLTCDSLAMGHRARANGARHGSISFSHARLTYGLAARAACQEQEVPIRSASPQDEFVQPLGAQLSRTLSAPLGMETDMDQHRRSKRLTRRHSRDSPASVTPRARSGLLDSSALGGLTASSSHSGSFSNIPGIRTGREQKQGDPIWQVGSLVSRRAALSGMVRAPSRLNRWLQQLPASQEEVGHGLTAAFYGAGSSSSSIGDMTEILDPADLEEASVMSLEADDEAAASGEGPGFEHALLLCIQGKDQQSASMTLKSTQLDAAQQLELELSLHFAAFAQVKPLSDSAASFLFKISC